MPEIKTNKDNRSTNDGLALIIGGLFVLALVFATYSYFNKSKDNTNNILDTNTVKQEADTDASLGDRIKELFNSQDEDKDKLNGDGAATKKDDEINKPAQVSGATTLYNGEMANWVANDYSKGEITGNSYVVKSGDTLWEIAEAKYGDGESWTKILAANSMQIEYLPSGEQALIVPGQSIVLP